MGARSLRKVRTPLPIRRFEIFAGGTKLGERMAKSDRQAVARFNWANGFEGFSVMRDIVTARIKPAPDSIAQLVHAPSFGCTSCGYVDPARADHCPNCDFTRAAAA